MSESRACTFRALAIAAVALGVDYAFLAAGKALLYMIHAWLFGGM